MNRIKTKQKILSLITGITLSLSFLFIYSNTTYASDPITINRISGQDRFETSVKLSQYWRQYSDSSKDAFLIF